MTTASAALRLAFSQAPSRWATALFAVLATFADVMGSSIALLGGAAWLAGAERTARVALLGALLVALVSRTLLAFVHGGAIRQSAAWLRGEGTGTALEEMFAAAPHSLRWFLWTLPIELLATLWKWLGLAAVVVAYGYALGTGRAGFSASVAFALFFTLSLPLALGWAALARATLVSAVREGLAPFAAASRALTELAARPGAYLAVLVTGAFGAALAEAMLSLFGSAFTPSGNLDLEPMLARQLAVGLLTAFTAALFELVILYGFTALAVAPPPPAPLAPPLAPPTVPEGWVAPAATGL